MSVTRASALWTPGRRRNANKENIYFEPGKGRKTGVTLADTGVRDEHGFEPVSGIFATPMPDPTQTPVSAPTTAIRSDHKRMSLLKFQSPRKTQLGGSPVRMSPRKSLPVQLGQASVEEPHVLASSQPIRAQDSPRSSATKPKKRKSLFQFDLSPAPPVVGPRSPTADVDQSIQDIAASLNDDYVPYEDGDQSRVSISYPEPSHGSPVAYPVGTSTTTDQSPPDDAVRSSGTKRKRGSSDRRRSKSASLVHSPGMADVDDSMNGRSRTHLDDSHAGPSAVLEASIPETSADVTSMQETDFQDEQRDETIEESTEIDQAPHEEDTILTTEPAEDPSPVPGSSGRSKKTANTRQPIARQRAGRRDHEVVVASDDEDTGPAGTRLRSVTPFEDDGARRTRSGRMSHKPFQFWKREGPVYDHGRVSGFVRAIDVSPPKRKFNRKKAAGKTRKNNRDVEEAIPEDLLPELWESEIQKIAGLVKYWDPEQGKTNQEEIRDVGFSEQAIALQEAGGGAFKYAKVVNEPFIGAGLVEIPPNGLKESKPSRSMHMVFFVHEGKVTVDVAGMQFGLTVGGVFVVPRGNDYSIANESTEFKAVVFFAQGCEPGRMDGSKRN